MTYTKCGSKDKSNFLQTAAAEQIQRHTNLVRQGLDPCILPPCPRCGITPNFFKCHEKHRRKFNIIFEQFVKMVLGCFQILERFRGLADQIAGGHFRLEQDIIHPFEQLVPAGPQGFLRW
jgi:hypothetical protein